MDTISCGACPLSRIFIDLIEGETENFSEMLFWLKQLRISNEMDGIVKKLLKKQSELKRIRIRKRTFILMTTLFSE
jgi:hypothetical protein